MYVHRIFGRPLKWVVTGAAGASLCVGLASALTDSCATAEQPVRPIRVPAVSVQPRGVSTSSATPSEQTLSLNPERTIDPAPALSAQELVPAADPVVVDDHGGGRGGLGSSDNSPLNMRALSRGSRAGLS